MDLVRSGQINPQQGQMDQAAQMLNNMKSPQPPGQGNEQSLFSLLQQIPKLKGAVLYEGKTGDIISLVLTDLKDKATIVNKLPPEFKGKVKFRSYVESEDAGLQAIVDNQGQGTVPNPQQPTGKVPAIA
jgi:hypothetical protein